MNVIGFDIGNESCCVAAVKDGAIDIILNDDAKRETPTVICFGEKQRFIGSTGAAFASKYPERTFTDLKSLLTLANDPIKLEYLSRDFNFTPTEMLAMIFFHLKQIAERNLESPVTNCVIGIPSYFEERQRRAYLNAAKIAGLKPLRLLHDCTAAALGYGFYKRDISSYERNLVAFVDVGQCDTQVSIANFKWNETEILSHTFDGSLGGRDFDEVIFRYFSNLFKEKYKIEVGSHPKARKRLKSECVKVKKVLSANTEASLNIEYFVDGVDVEGEITRKQFDDLCLELLNRIFSTCDKAATSAGIDVRLVSSVELIGSGSRIPSISKTVAMVFQKEPQRTLNASECIARGCALHCANLTGNPIFKDYEIKDSFPFSINISTRETGPFPTIASPFYRRKRKIHRRYQSLLPSNSFGRELFPTLGRYPDTKELKFQRKCPFEFQILNHQYSVINTITITDSERVNNGRQTVKLQIELDTNGIVKVHSPTREETVIQRFRRSVFAILWFLKRLLFATVQRNNGSHVSGVIGFRVNEQHNGGMSEADVATAKRKQLDLNEVDERVGRVNDSKNALESYVYDFRNKLNKKYANFVEKEEKDRILEQLRETEQWVCEEANERDEFAYNSKLGELKRVGSTISKRFNEEERRLKRII